MFSINYIRSVFGYHFWANEQILNKASQLPITDYMEDVEVGHGSLHNTLFHMMQTEKIWLALIQSGKLTQPPPQKAEFADLESLKAAWKVTETSYLQYLDQAQEQAFAEVIQVTDQNGVVTPIQCWRMFQHVLFHGAQHRAEAAIILTHFRQSPGDLDFIFY